MKDNKNITEKKAVSADRFSIHSFVSLSLLFVVTFGYFSFFGSYIFGYQDRQILFIYSSSYFGQFAGKPGGLLEYAGAFLSQAFFSPIGGAVILSLILVSAAKVFQKICISILGKMPLVNILMLIPPVLLMLFHSDFNFWLYNSLGFLLASLALLPVKDPEKRLHHIITIASFPVVYYFTGGYAWIFAGMYISMNISKRNIYYSIALLVTGAATLIVFKFVFLSPLLQLVYYPLPMPALYRHPEFLYALFCFFILFPLALRGISSLRLAGTDSSLSVYGMAALLSVAVFILSRLYNPGTVHLFRIENMFYRQEWDALIRYQEKTKSNSLIAQYYFNVALSEKGRLCDRLFYGPQDYGTKSLLIPWDSNTDINLIYRGAYFFYAAGLINEAHRWAFESMVMQGYKPENIKLLIKTELINGNFSVAKKYIHVLMKTMRYRNDAARYERMLERPDLVKSDPELGKKADLMPKKDFMMRLKDQQDNVLLLLQSNPSNRIAFEYMLAWYMLERNVDKIVQEAGRVKQMGYTKLPDHLEEAVLYYSAFTGDTDSLKISPPALARFKNYSNASALVNKLSPGNNSSFEKNFGNTFWYYLDFK